MNGKLPNMTIKSQVIKIVILGFTCLVASGCGQTSNEPFVEQKIPVQIQAGQPLTLHIDSLSGNGVQGVGLQVPSAIWGELSRNPRAITVRLTSGNDRDTRIDFVNPGADAFTYIQSTPNAYYLFEISGVRGASATFTITFPDAPAGVTNANIIVTFSAADGGP